MDHVDISCALFEITDRIAAAPADLGEAMVGLSATTSGHLEIRDLRDGGDHDAILVTTTRDTGDGPSGATVRLVLTVPAQGPVIVRMGTGAAVHPIPVNLRGSRRSRR